jgi:release factor glutamine methyltransferase
VPTVASLLKESGLPLAEARALLAVELASAREGLIAHPEREVDERAARRFEQQVARRRAGEPLAYLTGEREFYGRSFSVGPAVLVPRPETELLVQLAIERAKTFKTPKIIDLGTGSGCIAITLALELPRAQIWATDRSSAALDVGRTNARALGASVTFLESDWYAALAGRFDLVLSNPPYVAQGDAHLNDLQYEPSLALVAGPDGLACLRPIIAGARAHLSAGGWLLVEHGYDQGPPVRRLLKDAGLTSIDTVKDAANLERVSIARS